MIDYAHSFSSNEESRSDSIRWIVSALGDEGGEVYAREIPNTAAEWNKESGAIGVLDSLGDTGRAVRFVTIAKMATLPSDEVSDVGNLAHFILDWLALATCGSNVERFSYILVVDVSSQSIDAMSQGDDAVYRIAAELSLALELLREQQIGVYVYRPLGNGNSDDLRRIARMGSFAAAPRYWERLSGIVPAIPVTLGKGGPWAECPFVSLASLQSAESGLSRTDLECIEREASIPSRPEEGMALRALRAITAGLIANLEDGVSGTLSKKLSAEGKRKIKVEVLSVLKERLPSSNILAQFLFSYMTSYALRQKSC